MPDRSFYDVLGVSKGASSDELRKSYKRLAMKYHPDRNPDPKAEARFKEIQQAYAVLSDNKKRTMYDRFGTADPQAAAAGQAGGFSDGGFSDLFDQFFSGFGTAASANRTRGRDLQLDVELSLEEAAAGVTRQVRITAYDGCADCSSSGMEPGSRSIACLACGGTGAVRRQVAIFTTNQTCSRCRGLGSVPEKQCSKCGGAGRVRRQRSISVKIPAGVDSEDLLRLGESGEAGLNGGETGDLLVRISIARHPIFTRNGDNLHCKIPISYATATLGGKLEVPTLGKPKTIKVPEGFQSGQQLRVRGAGIRGLRSQSAGDLLCTLTVETPQKLSAEQMRMLKKFDESLDRHNAPNRDSWLAKAKRLFS